MSISLIMFLCFVALTLGITYWASGRSKSSSSFFAAGRQITAWQNGMAVAGDYMSAASFLGIAGMIAFFGYDGFMYSVGFFVAYLTVLFVVAEPLRNAGKYTMADVVAYRLKERPVRAVASLNTLVVSTFYMIAQMVGAGALVTLLLEDTGIGYEMAVVIVGVLMIVYVVFGGMIATTWVQIIKAVLLMAGTILLSILVMAHFGFSFPKFADAVAHVSYTDPATGQTVVRDFFTPLLKFKPPYGPLELISLGMALLFGTAGLPHILTRFYTVPDARTARGSVIWAMVIIGTFYLLTTFLGFGAATIVGRDYIAANGGENMSAPLLAERLGGEVFFAFISSVAFATILAVVAGLTISASTSFAHDLWANVIHRGKTRRAGEEVLVARIAAFVIGAASIALALLLKHANVAFLVGLAFAVAASANLPAILFSLFWRRFTTAGAIAGMLAGLLSSIGLILVSPSVMGADALFPLNNPGIVSIPVGLIVTVVASLCTREPEAEAKHTELLVRSQTGLGAEKATSH